MGVDTEAEGNYIRRTKPENCRYSIAAIVANDIANPPPSPLPLLLPAQSKLRQRIHHLLEDQYV